MVQHYLIQFTQEVVEKANKIWKTLKLEIPEVELSESLGVIGAQASITKKRGKITYNLPLYNENKNSYDDVVIHEVSHLITFKLFPKAKQYHGPEFRQICKALGGTGNTHHRLDVSSVMKRKKVYRWSCTCYTWSIGSSTLHKSYSKGSPNCPRCKGELNFIGILEK